MTFDRKILAAMLSTAVLVAPTAAWAAYDQALVLDGPGGDAINESQLSFTTASGQSVPVRASDDDEDEGGVFFILFPGSNAEAGTLTYPGPDGQPRTVAIPAAGAGRDIHLNVGTGAVTTRATPMRLGEPSGSSTPTGLRSPTVMGGAAYKTFHLPEAGYGVTNIFADEKFVLQFRPRINYAYYGGDALVPLGSRFTLGLGYHEGSGSGSASASVAPGGALSGFVNIADSPVFGTGFNFGDYGVDVDGWTDVRDRSFYGKFGYNIPCDESDAAHESNFVYLRLSYTQTRVRQDVHYSTPSFSDLYSDVHQELKNDRFSVGAGWYFNKFLTDNFAVGTNFEGTVHFNDRKLDSWQMINYFDTYTDTINVQDKKSDTSFGAAWELDGTYYFTPNFGLNVFGRFEWDDSFGRFANPLSGNDVLAGETAHIGNAHTKQYLVGARLIASF